MLTRLEQPREDAPIWAGKTAKDGKPTLYVCRNFACSPPVTDWAEVEALLR